MNEYNKHINKMPFPFYAQYKLDGVNCRAFRDESGEIQLITRNSKNIFSCDHIKEQLESTLDSGEFLEGELYNHTLDFDTISGLVRTTKNIPEEAKMLNFVQFKDLEYTLIESQAQLDEKLKMSLLEGYEGLVLYRINPKGDNFDRLKLKPFYDSEFEIIGFKEGTGKWAGMLGKFICITDTGEKFSVAMKVSEKEKRKLWIQRNFCIGKLLNVQYQATYPTGKPRFPRGIYIREDLT